MTSSLTEKLFPFANTLNGAIGSGNFDNVSFDEMRDAIVGGDPFEFLTRLQVPDEVDPADLDFSVFTESERDELKAEWNQLLSEPTKLFWVTGLGEFTKGGRDIHLYCNRGLSLMLMLVLRSIKIRTVGHEWKPLAH